MPILFNKKKYLKKIVIFLQMILPKTIFDKFYAYIFPKYKVIVRGAYKLKGLAYFITGNKKNIKMIRKIHQIMPYSLVGPGGLETTYKLARMMNEKNIEGNFVELGVAKGGCAALMSEIAFENDTFARKMWLFDSFEGLPDPTEEDYFRAGDKSTGDHLSPLVKGSCLGTLEEVQNLLLQKFNFPPDKIVFVKGWFQDTLPEKAESIGKIAVLRIDGDWYESTRVCMEYLYDQVITGGAVIIDDYLSCIGCKRAVDEFIAKRDLKINVSLDGRGGCYLIKS